MSLYVSFGGGVNSTAMLVGLLERGIRPDWVVFSDTGAEKPETYQHVREVSKWLSTTGDGDDSIVWLKKTSMYESLEDECLRKEMLPSLAYGFRSCSQKWKHEPQRKFLNNDALARNVWERGEKVTKCIGFGVDELYRAAKDHDDEKYRYWYPLIDWRWNRNDCIEAVKRAGLSVPPKSSCFFCPAMHKSEIVSLHAKHPHLWQRAIDMEANARLTTIKGLGRSFSWRDLSGPETVEQVCMCFDGEE
jgi:hypothetical protein